jgi:hypothetical protein
MGSCGNRYWYAMEGLDVKVCQFVSKRDFTKSMPHWHVASQIAVKDSAKGKPIQGGSIAFHVFDEL